MTSQTVAHQAPLFMRFSRQEYWSGLPFPPPGNKRRVSYKRGFPDGSSDKKKKNLPAVQETQEMQLDPWVPGGGNGNPLQ